MLSSKKPEIILGKRVIIEIFIDKIILNEKINLKLYPFLSEN